MAFPVSQTFHIFEHFIGWRGQKKFPENIKNFFSNKISNLFCKRVRKYFYFHFFFVHKCSVTIDFVFSFTLGKFVFHESSKRWLYPITKGLSFLEIDLLEGNKVNEHVF